MILFLFVLWIIFNGQLTLEIVLFGCAFAALLYLFMYKAFGYTLKTELKLYVIAPSLLWYGLVLVFEIIKANFQTAGIMIFRGQKNITPQVVHFRTTLKSDFMRVLLSNSITLTPGTITVALKEDELTVHCLDKSMAVGIEVSGFVKKLEKIEKRWLA